MKIAIISDIHANLEALTAVLANIKEQNPVAVYCLGDIVGYGANPNECVDIVRESCALIVKGNHDDAAVNKARINDFTPAAKSALKWTFSSLTEDRKEFLLGLPLVQQDEFSTLVHSNPFDPGEWEYIMTHREAELCFPHFKTEVCWIGHTHHPALFCEDDDIAAFGRGHRFLINAGSVGQPRDGDWRACYALFDSDEWYFERIRVAYDVKTARDKIIKAGLPKFLGDRLMLGR